MKRLGLLMAGDPESAIHYWQELLGVLHRRLRGASGPPVVAEMLPGAWPEDWTIESKLSTSARLQLVAAARRLAGAGAGALVLCSPSLHLHARQLRTAAHSPILPVTAAVAAKLRQLRLGPPVVLGLDRPSGEEAIWRASLSAGGAERMIVPSDLDHAFVREQLRVGLASKFPQEDVQAAFTRLSADLKAAGARVIVLARPALACGLREENSELPMICAVQTHCEYAIAHAVEGSLSMTSA